MKQFLDSKNRSWQIALNCDSIEAAETACDVNVLDIADPESGLLAELVAFPPLCCKILEALLADQIQAAKIEPKDFRQSMNGDAICDAMEGLRDEIVDFFPKSRRPLLKKVQEKQQAVETMGLALAMERLSDPRLLAAAEAQLRTRIEEQLATVLPATPPTDQTDPTDPSDPSAVSATTCSMPVIAPPALSASTPDASPTASSV